MSTPLQTLELLSGSYITLGVSHSALIPKEVTFETGQTISLENHAHEYLGTAEVTHVKVVTFALAQASDLAITSHTETTCWPNALATLTEQFPDFSQLDKVSIVTFFVDIVAGSGLVINADSQASLVGAQYTAPVPSEEEQLAALSTISALGQEEVNGNRA